MACAGKLFERGWSGVEGNWPLLTQIVSENEIGLVVGEDEIGRLYVPSNELHRSRYMCPTLIGTVHSGRSRLAKGNTGHKDESADRKSAPPSV